MKEKRKTERQTLETRLEYFQVLGRDAHENRFSNPSQFVAIIFDEERSIQFSIDCNVRFEDEKTSFCSDAFVIRKDKSSMIRERKKRDHKNLNQQD